MYLTPVVYGTSLVPERYRWLMGLNPMTGVVEGFRWAVFGPEIQRLPLSDPIFGLSILVTVLVLVGGLIYFRMTERIFADLV
jgi:lipopolysaccharide transport system permease protein